MIELKSRLKKAVYEKLKAVFPLSPEDLDFCATPDRKMGDLALTFPFQLAKKLQKAPRDIAAKAVTRLGKLDGVRKITVAGGGYVNFFLERKEFFSGLLGGSGKPALFPEEAKIIIEHTNINPNKAAHIGHLRNACLGDTLGRCLKHRGENVEIQNYIDDTGVQVVDVVFGLTELEGRSLADLEDIPGRFDYYCWDLYARVSAFFAGHPEAQSRRSEILKKIELGDDPEYAMSRQVSRRILRAHLETMKRLGITYDVLPCESSILHLKFWDRAFDLLKRKNAIRYADVGENKGCWVMSLEDDAEREKVIVRSDGTVTYVGKDIAYQLWKFGLLGLDFHYEPFIEEEGRTIWISTSSPTAGGPSYGGASKVYNVIDARQSYLQKVVVQGLKSLQYDEQAEKSIHFAYEMVALSPKSLRELGYTPTEEDKDRTFLEVSGRKGLGVKADDLIDRLEQKALTEVVKRNPEMSADDSGRIAREIACGALRYFMLKFARNSLIVFDFDEALSFEGETGPYLQYTFVRMNSIFRKLREREGTAEEDVAPPSKGGGIALDRISEKEYGDFWDLVLDAAGLEDEIVHSTGSLEFSHLAKFAFNLCQRFNTYYHLYPVLAEEDPEIRNLRLLTIKYIKGQLRSALSLMGIPLPERM